MSRLQVPKRQPPPLDIHTFRQEFAGERARLIRGENGIFTVEKPSTGARCVIDLSETVGSLTIMSKRDAYWEGDEDDRAMFALVEGHIHSIQGLWLRR